MKIDIYIHGVPNGQRIWGTGGDDQIINQFYGAGNDEQTKFLAEVRKSGGHNYCYYSMLKYKNITAESGRAGSYFGITIRMDMVCTKVKTMFQILDLIYNNAILGKFLKKDGDRLKYTVSDFKEKDSHCKSIHDKLITMLDQSVEAADFVAIAPSMLKTKSCPRLNSAEYSSETAFASITQNGCIAISSEYPSLQMAAYIRKKDAEINSIKQQSQQDISRIQQQASQELTEQERRSNAVIQQTREQAALEIEQTKARYANIDRKMQTYEQQVKMLERTSKELHTNIAQMQRTIQQRDATIAQLRNTGNGSSQTVTRPKPSITTVIATRIVPFVNLLIAIAVMLVLCLRMPSDNSTLVEQISSDLTELKEKMATDTIHADTAQTTVKPLIEENSLKH